MMMEPDRLECLLDSFMDYRSGSDTVDTFCTATQNLPGQLHFNEGNGIGIIASNSQTLAQAVQSAQVTELGRYLADLADQFPLNQQNSGCVRFEKSCIIVAPEEQIISLTVIRSDVAENTVRKVTWKTIDKTALSGIHYVGSSGEIVFDKGEMKKSIQIKILPTTEDTVDLRFNVEVSILGGFNPKTMTITLKKLNNFYDDERRVIESLPFSLPFTVEDIRSVLEISLNNRTFHMALTHLCSVADSVHLEYALALDLSRLCLPNLQRTSIMKVLKDFFRWDKID